MQLIPIVTAQRRADLGFLTDRPEEFLEDAQPFIVLLRWSAVEGGTELVEHTLEAVGDELDELLTCQAM